MIGHECRGAAFWLALLLIVLGPDTLRPAAAEPPALELTDRATSFSLDGYLSAFHDTSGQMDLAAITAAEAQGAFKPVDGAFNPGVDNSGTWWLRFVLRAPKLATDEWWLSIGAHPLTAMVDAYVPRRGQDGRIRHVWRASGTDVPVAERALPVPAFVFRMSLEPGRDEVIYVRMAGTRHIRAQVSVYRLNALVGHIVSTTTMLSMMLGAGVFLGLTAAVMGAWLRELRLVLLGINTVFMTALQMMINGLALPVTADLSTRAIEIIHSLIVYLTALSLVLTIMAVFRGFRAMPWIRRFMQGFLAFCVIGLVLAPLGFHQRLLPVLLVIAIAFSLMTMFASYRWMKAGEPSAVWYLIGLSANGVLLTVYAGRVLGLLPLTSISAWVFPALVLVQIVAIAIGITVMMQTNLRSRQALEQELLATSRRNERLLEEAVNERTSALREENEARRQAEAALRQALREQRNLLSMVSHEFRTPLAIIGAAVEVVRSGGKDLAALEERELGKIGRAARRLTGLIDTFLAEEWLNRAQLQLQPRRVDLRSLLADTARDSGTEAERPVTVEGPPALPAIVDPMLIRVAVSNLISNAVKYSAGPIALTLGAHADAGTIEIRVADQGPGIPAEEREAIFERYYRSSSHAALPGAGLGLFIVRQVAGLHGGTVRVEDGPAGGSAFIITLPDRLKTDAA